MTIQFKSSYNSAKVNFVMSFGLSWLYWLSYNLFRRIN